MITAFKNKSSNLITIFNLIFIRGSSSGFQFLLNVFLGRLLGPEGMGIYYIYTSWNTFLSTLASIGLPLYSLKNISILKSKNKLHDIASFIITSILFIFIVGLPLTILIIFFNKDIAHLFLGSSNFGVVISLAAIGGFVFAILRILVESLKGIGKPNTGIALEFSIIPLGLLIVISVLFYTTRDVSPYTVLYVHVLILILSVIFSIIFLKKNNIDLSPTVFKNNYLNIKKDYELRKILIFWGTMLLNVLSATLPFFLIPFYSSAEEVAKFGIANKLVSIAATFLMALASFFAPKFASYYSEYNITSLTKELRNSRIYSFIAYLPFFIVFIFLSDWILNIFGEEFVDAKIYLYIFAIGQLINSTTGLAGHFLNMVGKEKLQLYNMMISILLMLILSVILGRNYGALGVTIAYSISIVVNNILAVILSKFAISNMSSKKLGSNQLY